MKKTPRPNSAGSFKVICLAILSLILLGGLAFWLTLNNVEKDALLSRAADMVNNAVADTPLAGIGDLMRHPPPPPPPRVINPPTGEGTLAGRAVTGTIASPLILGRPATKNDPESIIRDDSANSPQDSEESLKSATTVLDASGKPVFTPNVLPASRVDSRVPPSYLEQIAQWLAARYKTEPGTLAISPQSMNQLLGVTLAGQSRGGRGALLHYAFQPTMLTSLYKLYIDQFMRDLNLASQKKGFNEAQNNDFHMALAGGSALMASALESITQTPELGARLQKIEQLGQKAREINTQLTAAVQELDELRHGKAGERPLEATRLRVDGISARYRRAMEEYTVARRDLAALFKKQMGQPMDDDALLFLAAWVDRRLAAGGSARDSLNSCVALLRDLSRRCEQAGKAPIQNQ